MTIAATLENMGLTLIATTDGNLTLEGLKSLSRTDREAALTVARDHKAAILEELRMKAVHTVDSPGRRPSWHDICPDYFMGCFECPDYTWGHPFCAKYGPSGEVLQ